jgi:hypothetical protein
MKGYAGMCGTVLAIAHARTGDAAAIAGYIGNGDAFIQAVADFADAYADQNERDYAAFTLAIREGRLESAAPATTRKA